LALAAARAAAVGASILIQNLVPMRMIDSKTNLLQQYLPVAETSDGQRPADDARQAAV
jgi:hypothetical protein